jgi:LPXTG-motif cell wall-anchored protein
MLRKILLSSAVWLCLMGAGPAGAQSYTPPTVRVSDPTPFPGQTITIYGSGFPPLTAITITINPTLYATSDANGDWSTTFTIPEDFPLGVHTIVATGGGVTATTTFTEVLPEDGEDGEDGEPAQLAAVSAQPPVSDQAGPSGQALPTTGSDSALLVRVGLVLLAVGGVLVGLARRRSHRISDPVA